MSLFNKKPKELKQSSFAKASKDKEAEPKEVKESGLPAGAFDVSLVLRGAHVTEKAGLLNGINQYVFKVAPRSNKIEIKKAVEKMYGVKVDQVRISVMPSKKRRLGNQEGEKGGFKKAMVKLAGGEKIDIMPK
ncbi:MAG: 50S ribosomal protein L23 [Candidatus Wildermuthbacteria bacterium]|nr:50S ribosomal protein L23 [Candidatus Wildermuthbacteria bacterium]